MSDEPEKDEQEPISIYDLGQGGVGLLEAELKRVIAERNEMLAALKWAANEARGRMPDWFRKLSEKEKL